MPRLRHTLTAATSLLLLLLTACGGGSDQAGGGVGCVKVESGDENAPYMQDVDVPPELEAEPKIEMDDCGDPPDELVSEDIVEGTGETVEEDSTVSVNYVGVLWPDGTEFDSSWSRSQVTSFELSAVIPGWSTGLVGMKEGGRRLLVIPPELAYGEQGAGSDIPPNSTLVFVVDVVDVEPPVEVPAGLEEKPAVQVPAGEAPPAELVVEDIQVGTGTEASAGDTVTVNYVGVGWSTGTEFDSSWQTGSPATFSLEQVVPGFSEGIAGMKVGGRRKIVIPPALGYGAEGRPPVIPPNETLLFVVDLLAVEPGADADR